METGANMHVRGPGTSYTPEDGKAPMTFRAIRHKRTISINDDLPGGTVKVAEIPIATDWSPRKGKDAEYAALIVRAVNSHEALLKALAELLSWCVGYEKNIGNAMAQPYIDAARAALQKARKESQ